jgi:hypothetical protein
VVWVSLIFALPPLIAALVIFNRRDVADERPGDDSTDEGADGRGADDGQSCALCSSDRSLRIGAVHRYTAAVRVGPGSGSNRGAPLRSSRPDATAPTAKIATPHQNAVV